MKMQFPFNAEDGSWLDCVPGFGFSDADRDKIYEHRKVRHREELEHVNRELKKRGIDWFEIDESRSVMGFGTENLVCKPSPTQPSAYIYFDTPRNQNYVNGITVLIHGVYYTGRNEIPQFRHRYAYDFKNHVPLEKFFDSIKKKFAEIRVVKEEHEKSQSTINRTYRLLKKRLEELGHGVNEQSNTRLIVSIDTGESDVDVTMKTSDDSRISIEMKMSVDVDHIDALLDAIVGISKFQTIRKTYS